MAQAKRYGSKNGRPVPLSDYHQSKDNAAEYPPTTTEKVITTNLPNIFSYRSYIFAKKPELVQRFVKATKADVGGVGGHVVAAEEVKGVITQVRPGQQLVPGRADVHVAHRDPHR